MALIFLDMQLNMPKGNKNKIIKHDISKKLPFKSKYFDLVLSINTIHNLEIFNLKSAIEEIQSWKKKFIVVEVLK